MTDDIRLLDYALGGLLSISGWIGANTLKRVARLEKDKQDAAVAAADRAEIKDDLHDMSDRMDKAHERIFKRLDDLADRVSSHR